MVFLGHLILHDNSLCRTSEMLCDITLSRTAGMKYHIHHISTERVAEKKRAQTRVSAIRRRYIAIVDAIPRTRSPPVRRLC